MDLRLPRAALAEGCGTYALTFVTVAVACTDVYSGGEVGLVGQALAQGLILAAAVMAIGSISGGHVNPAVTVAAVLVGRIRATEAFVYVGAQLFGAALAGLMASAVYAADVWDPVKLGTPLLGPGVAPGTGVFIEAVLAFLLALTVLATTRDSSGGYVAAGAAAGAVLASAVLVAGPITGAALNPARALGPALVSGHFVDQQVYWTGPLLGAILAAVVYGLILPWGRTSEESGPRNETDAREPGAGEEATE